LIINSLNDSFIKKLFLNTHHIAVDELLIPIVQELGIQLQIVRIDQVHPVVSGNKFFKLHNFVQLVNPKATTPQLITFGGAYSNHLAATAFYCKQADIRSKAFVRGEAPANWSHTLLQCKADGMELAFLSRTAYCQLQEKDSLYALQLQYPDSVIVPEGGYHPVGATGAARIYDHIPPNATHIICAAGTGTTAAGLLQRLKPHQQLIIIPVLKGLDDIHDRLSWLTGQPESAISHKYQIWDQFHFGGYAKKTPELIQFMNAIYEAHQLPTDFVYTAKMLFGVIQKIKEGYFPTGAKIAAIHTGGLQGNNSLPSKTLTF
jgi:1-aminocyclopropane-1-carboxylate deaminase/D-cysteine desulfhydrase-like pyridoxal-dependent ACC family enzyme